MAENNDVFEENTVESRKVNKAGELVEKKGLVTRAEFNSEEQLMDQAVKAAGKQATSLKEVIDVGLTGIAIHKDGVLDNLTAKKERELKEDALAKVIASEVARIEQETNKALEEGRKQLAELQNRINEVRAVKERLEQEADRNKAYFDCHKSLLKYAGCVEVMSMKYMKTMAAIGFIIMCFVKIIFSPLILIGLFIETLLDIIGGVTKTIANNAAKTIVSLLLVVLILGVVAGAYFGIVELLKFV